jgi:hypothetical protein
MSISEARKKLKHISPHAIKHAISSSFITRITLDPDLKPEFCEACTKAKSTWQPFPKESSTRAENFGKRVHWDLWGLTSVISLNGNSYMAAHIDDVTCKSKLYFQQKRVKC